MKKFIAIATALTVVALIAGPGTAQALTADELQAQINNLLNTLKGLQDQLAVLQGGGTAGGTTTIAGCAITSFDRSLKVTMTGDDVKCLQIVLNSDPATKLADSGVGSPGNETSYFGPLTKGAVIKFQEKYADEVLASWGLTKGTGFVGSTTRAKLNALLTAGGTTDTGTTDTGTTDTGTTDTGTTDTDTGTGTTTTSGLTVGLASDTPVSTTVPDNGVVNFTKFTLTAGSEGDVKISKIYVTRTGLSANSDVENIKIIDAETGGYVGSIGSLNVDNRAMITFVPELVIKAGVAREFYIRASIKNGATAGITAVLGIASNDDIVSDASEVSGAPVNGNPMSVVTLTIGTATVSEITITDASPDVGDTDVDALEFKVAAGSTEPITIETITVKKAGTADATDTNNIELYSATDSESLGTVSSWNSEEKVTWSNLGIVVNKGKSYKFKVRLDIASGVSSTAKTVNVDLVDGSDVLMVVKGNTYGTYIDPDRSPSTWDGLGVAQTINAGSLTITKSSDTPATGNISAGDEINLGVFDFEAKGEDVKVTAVSVVASTLTGFSTSDITNVGIYDENDDIVTGPSDLGSDSSVDFTDTFIVPVGIHEYTVKATVADSADTGNIIKIGIESPGTKITASGMTSGDTITATPSDTVNANTQTVAAGSLIVTTLAFPASRSIPSPISNFVFATFSLDAASSGEDVNITAITVTDSLGTGAAAGDIDSAELWADLTDANSDRGDIYETRISDTEQPSATTQAYTLNQTIVVPKGGDIRIALLADLASGVSGNHTFSIVSDNVTATGASTDQTVSPSYTVTGKQTLSVGTAALTVTADADTPDADIIVGNKTSTLAVFKLAASNVEDLDLDQITLSTTNGAYVNNFYLKDENGNVLGKKAGQSAPTFVLADGTITIPANESRKLTVEADLLDVDGSTRSNGDTVKVGLETANSVQTTGLGSGSSVNSSVTAYGNSMSLYKSRPYFALNSNSKSGNLNPSSNTEVAIFDITAEDTDDITFQNDADDSILKIAIDATVGDTATGYVTLTLKDSAGNVLGVDSVNFGASLTMDGSLATFDSSNSWGTTIDGTATNSFTISKGSTKKLYVSANTLDFEDDGDLIQVWLSDAADANVTFGINGSGKYAEGTKIFRGDIYANSFVNPS